MKITFSNIRDFIQGHFNYYLSKYDELPTWIQEQAEIRIKKTLEKSPECLENNACVKCGCSTPALHMAPSRKCKTCGWGSMLSKTAWEEQKQLKETQNDEA